MEDLTLFMRLIELMRQQHVLMLFLILGLGYLIGNIRIGSFSLGPVAGVLFAGLFFQPDKPSNAPLICCSVPQIRPDAGEVSQARIIGINPQVPVIWQRAHLTIQNTR